MLCYPGKVSVYFFLGAIFSILSLSAIHVLICAPKGIAYILIGAFLYYILLNILIRFIATGYIYQIGVRSVFLGFILSNGLLIAQHSPFEWKPFGMYAIIMSLFHYTEFLGIAWSNPKSLSIDSFILYHSLHYAIAAMLSWLEFIVEVLLFPRLKEYYVMWILGFLMCFSGELLRKLAMVTAKTNFNHLVQDSKAEDHQLVTHGIYGLVRHPSYVGWFWWSIGTQILLCNPICVMLYTIASWKFFKERIFFEEITLLKFFGNDYYDYQQKVPTGLPMIQGYQLESET